MAINVEKLMEKITWIKNGEPDQDYVYNRPLEDFIKLLKLEDPDLKGVFEQFFEDSSIGGGGSTKIDFDSSMVSKDVVPGDAVYIDYSGMVCKAIGEKNIKSRVAGIYIEKTNRNGDLVKSVFTGGIIENFPKELEVGKFYYLSLEKEGEICHETNDENGDVIPYNWVVGIAKSANEFIVRPDYICPCDCHAEDYWGHKKHPNFIDNDMMGSWVKKETEITPEPGVKKYPFVGDGNNIFVFIEGIFQQYSSFSVADGFITFDFDFKGGEVVYIVEFSYPLSPRVEKVQPATATYVDFGQKLVANCSFVFVEGVMQLSYSKHVDKAATAAPTPDFSFTANTGRFAQLNNKQILKGEVACLATISDGEGGGLERGLKVEVFKKSANMQNKFTLAKECLNPMIFVNGIFQAPNKDYFYDKAGQEQTIDFGNDLTELDEVTIFYQVPEPKKK